MILVSYFVKFYYLYYFDFQLLKSLVYLFSYFLFSDLLYLDHHLMKVDQKKINIEIDKQEGLRIESQSNKNIEILKNKKPKSNFI